MGWLKPEVDLIDPEFRGDWAHLREQPGDPPAGPATVTARGQRVQGLRIDGDSVTQEEFVLDGGFDVCAVPEMMGLPLMAKRLHGEEATEEPCSLMRAFLMTQMMTAPGLGPPLAWSGAGPLPPVLLARADGLRLGPSDLACLREFLAELAEENRPEDLARLYNPAHLRRWIGLWSHTCALDTSRRWEAAFEDIEPALEVRFPVGLRVTVTGTSREPLNGQSGFVRRYDAPKGRVGVELPPPHGLVSLRPANLRVEPAVRKAVLLQPHRDRAARRTR